MQGLLLTSLKFSNNEESVHTAFSLGVLLANDFNFSFLEFGFVDSDFFTFSGIRSGAFGISATPADQSEIIEFKYQNYDEANNVQQLNRLKIK